MNTVQLIGRLARDVELRATQSGTPVANLRLAVDRRPRNGETPEPIWLDVTCWGKLAEVVAAHCQQGRQLAVSGRLEQDVYVHNDENRSKVYVVAETVDFLAKPNGTTAAAASSASKKS